MIAAARKYLGRPYDVHYEMDDGKIYCSELIYKGYLHATGRPLGKLVKLRELAWKRYAGTIREIEGEATAAGAGNHHAAGGERGGGSGEGVWKRILISEL